MEMESDDFGEGTSGHSSPRLCLCEGYQNFLRKDKFPILCDVAVHIKTGHYPHLRCNVITWGLADEHACLCIERRKADLSPDKGGPFCVAQVNFFESGKASFVVNYSEVSSLEFIETILPFHHGDSSDILGEPLTVHGSPVRVCWDQVDLMLRNLGWNHGFCMGIPASEYESVCSTLRFIPRYMTKEETPLPIYRSKKCVRWVALTSHVSKEMRASYSAGEGRCKECSGAYVQARRTNAQTSKYSPGTLKRRAEPSSNYPAGLLSPLSLLKRYKSLRKDYKRDHVKVRQLQERIKTIYSIDLCDEQNRIMREFVDDLKEKDPKSVKLDETLDDFVSAGDDTGDAEFQDQSNRREAFKEAFFEDLRRNRDGHHGNRWSMSTYRIALSMYTRSPSAYRHLESWKLFQLPSVSSLKRFTSAHLQKPGPYFEYIMEQAQYYEKFKEDVKAEGRKEPNGEGVLILDEVKVIGKVIWNSKNGEILGLAMDPSELVSAVDLSSELQTYSSPEADPAEYIMQFLWRDLSSNFDVIGPHYSSESTMTAKFTTDCLMETIHAFQVYGFKVVCTVLDGASTNLAMVKWLSGFGKGAYGLRPAEDGGDRHAVQPWFDNPTYPELKIYFVICPTHQLKNMINQLFASKADGTKAFLKAAQGTAFGWKQIIDMWHREEKRRNDKQIRLVPGLVQSFIERDSWTKLNVKPAKIMQQGGVLAELYSFANPDSSQQPENHEEVMATYEYLEACSKLFEYGFLNTNREAKIRSTEESTILKNINEGFDYFRNWSERLLVEADDFSMTSPKEKRFISWQTYDLLRVCVYSFNAFCANYLMRNEGMYLVPMKLNGSAVETLFSQLKYAAGGKLSSVNYEHAKRTLMLRKNIHGHSKGEKGYRDVELHTMDIPLKRKGKK